MGSNCSSSLAISLLCYRRSLHKDERMKTSILVTDKRVFQKCLRLSEGLLMGSLNLFYQNNCLL